MLMFSHDGEAGFTGTLTMGDTAVGFNALLLKVPLDATHWVRYTTGATAALQIGETLTGGTSNATATLVAQAVESGTAGSSDTGILFVRQVSGVFQGETLTGGTSTGTVAIAEALIPNIAAGLSPKMALISVETYSMRWTIDGTNPTLTAGTSFGHLTVSGAGIEVRGYGNVRNFKCVNAVSGENSVIKYSLLY